MRTARLRIVRWGGGGEGVLWPGPMSMSGGGGGKVGVVTRSHVHVQGGGGVVTRSHVHVGGGGVLWPGPMSMSGGEGGGWGLWPGPMSMSGEGREVLSRGIWCCNTSVPPPPPNACENITFARFAKRAVKISLNKNIRTKAMNVLATCHQPVADPGFPRKEASTLKGVGTPTYYFVHFPRKLHGFE